MMTYQPTNRLVVINDEYFTTHIVPCSRFTNN